MLRIGPHRDPVVEPRDRGWLGLVESAALDRPRVIHLLGSTPRGLTSAEARRRLEQLGANAVRSFAARPLAAIRRQLIDPLHLALVALLLLAGWQSPEAALPAGLALLFVSAALGALDEVRVERAVEELHARIRHTIPTRRDGRSGTIDVTELVPGDVVSLRPGSIVPADLRILESSGLVCDQSILGGSENVRKSPDACRGTSITELSCCLLMGSIVKSGSALAIVVRTGAATAFAELTGRLDARAPVSIFERRLADTLDAWHRPLRWVAIVVLAVAAMAGRPILVDAAFVLALFVGLSPRRAATIARLGLVHGARRLAARAVMVKRTATIEDLGLLRTLCLDPVGIFTEGRPRLRAAVDAAGVDSARVVELGLACSEALSFRDKVIGGSALDRALFDSIAVIGAGVQELRRLDSRPFEERTGMASALVDEGSQRRLVVRGLPEILRTRLRDPSALDAALAPTRDGAGIVHAVATAAVGQVSTLADAGQPPLELAGFLAFEDPAKSGAADAVERLRALGVDLKVIVASDAAAWRDVCRAAGIDVERVLDVSALEAVPDDEVSASLAAARLVVAPTAEQRARVVRLECRRGGCVGYMGDGSLDAVALHDADVGISTDSATEGARDAADVVLLRKDLHALADGVGESRTSFANAMNQALVLGGAGRASTFVNLLALFAVPFVPLLTSQVLAVGLAREVGARALERDRIDPERLARPIGCESSYARGGNVFTAVTVAAQAFALAVLTTQLAASPASFRTAWFLVLLGFGVLALLIARSARLPFLRSVPSVSVSLAVVATLALWAAAAYGWLTAALRLLPLREPAVDEVAESLVAGGTMMQAARAFLFLTPREAHGRPPSPAEDRLAKLSFRWSGKIGPAHRRLVRRLAPSSNSPRP